MKFRSIALLAMLAAVAVWPSLVSAEAASQQRQTTTPAFQETIPNIPGKSLVGLVVNYPPGGATQAHYHHVPPSSPATYSRARSEAR